LALVQCGYWVQAADAAAARHEQLVAQNQALERDYERFKKKKNLQERIAVSGWLLRSGPDRHLSSKQLLC
jgi:hypothetical protein